MDLAFTQFILILVIRVMESTANDERTPENNTNVDDCRPPRETMHTADSHASTESACGISSGGQLAIYKPVLPMLEQSEREFEIAGHKWTINQQWSGIGLSAVIWEAVSQNCLMLEF